MPFKTEQELDTIRQNLESVVWPLLSDFDNKSWQLKAGKDRDTTGLVYKGQLPKIGTVWKVEAVLDCSADEYYQRFINPGDLTGKMPNISKYEILEQGQDWNVTHTVSLGFGPLSSRDFVGITFHKVREDGCHFNMNVSIEHPVAPVSNGCVRAEYLPSGSIVRPLKDDPKRCELYWTNNVDMKGYLPRSVLNLVMSNHLVDIGKEMINRSKEIATSRKL